MLNKKISATKGITVVAGYTLALAVVLSVVNDLRVADWMELAGMKATQTTEATYLPPLFPTHSSQR